jgi:hypothetical protein
MNWIGQKLELQIIIIKSNLIIKDPKRIGSVALQRIAIPIIPGKFEIRMRSRSNPQNNGIFRIAPIHDPIRQKPAEYNTTKIKPRVSLYLGRFPSAQFGRKGHRKICFVFVKLTSVNECRPQRSCRA